MTQRIPTHDLDAEAAVLSASILSRDALADVRSLLRPEHFYADAHRRIFEAACTLDDAGEPVDLTLLAGELRRTERLGQVGGTPYLAQIADATPAVAHVSEHARVVLDHARKRMMVAECQRLAAEGYGDVGDVSEWLVGAASAVANAADTAVVADTLVSAREAGAAAWNEIIARSRGEMAAPGIPTGFAGVDWLLGGGMRIGCQYCVGGRPAHGKSTVGLQIGVNVASAGYGVAIASCEMPTEQVTIRGISQLSQMDGRKLERGELKGDDWSDAASGAKRWGELPLMIDDRPAQTLAGVRAMARRAESRIKRDHGADKKLVLLVVDYIQIMNGERRKGETRETEVARLSTGLLWIAREFGCIVLTISQLNREAAKRGNLPPRLSDLRESGAIEQDNFGVLFVWNPDADEPDPSKRTGESSIIVAKVRQGGRTGRVKTKFKGACTSFYELEPEREPDEWDEGWTNDDAS